MGFVASSTYGILKTRRDVIDLSGKVSAAKRQTAWESIRYALITH